MKPLRILLVISLVLCLALTACGGNTTAPQTPPATAASPAATTTPAATTAAPSPSASVEASATPNKNADLVKNDTGKTMIRKISLGKINDISVLIVSKAGTVIACDPMIMPKGVTPDIIAVTHDHHIDEDFLKKCPDAKTTVQKVETFTEKDVTVTGIAASHINAPIKEGPSLVIYAFDVDGLRIAFFACCGQEKLTPEQMKALGNVDIALITDDTDPGWISVELASGLMKQLKPKMIIPLSHHKVNYDNAIQTMCKTVGGELVTVDEKLGVSKEDLTGKTKVVKLKNPVGTI